MQSFKQRTQYHNYIITIMCSLASGRGVFWRIGSENSIICSD